MRPRAQYVVVDVLDHVDTSGKATGRVLAMKADEDERHGTTGAAPGVQEDVDSFVGPRAPANIM